MHVALICTELQEIMVEVDQDKEVIEQGLEVKQQVLATVDHPRIRGHWRQPRGELEATGPTCRGP